MASQNELEFLAGKALLDRRFRARLLKNPAKTAKGLGISLDPDQLKLIEGMRPADMDKLAEHARRVITHKRLRGAAWTG